MKVAIALMLRLQGVGFREAGPASGLAVRTVQRLVVDHADSLSGLKAILAREMATVAVKARTALSERLDMVLSDPAELKAIRANDLAVVVVITTDKAAALAAIPATVVNRGRGPLLEDAAAEIQAVRERLAVRNRPA